MRIDEIKVGEVYGFFSCDFESRWFEIVSIDNPKSSGIVGKFKDAGKDNTVQPMYLDDVMNLKSLDELFYE